MKKILAIVLTLVMLLSCAAFAEEAKPVILVVSFGTSYNDNRDLSIGGVEEAILIQTYYNPSAAIERFI